MSDNRCLQIDGLRGIAVILVVLSHNYILNQGGIANAIFFAIAGFLFINPFKDSYEKRYESPINVIKYYANRIVRIMPSYYIVLLAVVLITGFTLIPKDLFIDNLYLVHPYDHLWFVHSMIRNCLIFPPVMMVFVILSGKISVLRNDKVCAVLFALSALVIRIVCMKFYVYDSYMYEFIMGVATAYLYRAIRHNKKSSSFISSHKTLGDILIACVFVFIILTAETLVSLVVPSFKGWYIGWNLPLVCSVVMSILLLLTVMFRDGFFGKLFASKPLRFIGKISLQIYLIHWFIIPFVHVQSKYLAFIIVFALTLLPAWVLELITSKRFWVTLLRRSDSRSGHK